MLDVSQGVGSSRMTALFRWRADWVRVYAFGVVVSDDGKVQTTCPLTGVLKACGGRFPPHP
jgi:hypothetical protein